MKTKKNKPRVHQRAAEQMRVIYREFMSGASMRRIGRKHSLPVGTVEFVIRCYARAMIK